MIHRPRFFLLTCAATLLISAFVFPSSRATAQEQQPEGDKERIYVESAEYMKHEKQTNLTTLRGAVRIKVNESSLLADEVVLNEDANTLTASGRVTIEDGGDMITGTALFYDYDAEYFEMANPEGSTTSDDVDGRIYYRGVRAWGTRRKIRIHKGQFTTCEPTCPNECHMSAKEIAIYPNIKIISRHTRFFIGPRRIWYMPIHVISLKNREQNMPEFGYTKEEGFYVKTKYPYMTKEAMTGLVLLDFFTRKGTNFGTEHKYKSKKLGGEGYNKYKTIREKDTGRVSTEIVQWQDFVIGSKTKGKINYNRMSSYSIYQDRSRVNNASIDLTLNREIKRDYAPSADGSQAAAGSGGIKRQESLQYIVRRQYGISESFNSDTTIRQNFFFNQNLNALYDLKITQSQYGNNARDREANFNGTLTRKDKIFNLTARFVKALDLDKETYKNDNTMSVNTVLPEVTLDVAPDLLGGLIPVKNPSTRPNITMKAVHGRYREGQRNASYPIRRTSIENSITRSFTFSKNTTFTPRQTYTQYFYQTHDAKYVLMNNTTLTHKFTPATSLNFNYIRQQDAGGAPYQKDRVGESNSLGGVFNVNKQRTTFSLTSGYNYEIKTWQPLNSGYMHALSRNSTIDVKLGFDLESDTWSPTVTNFKIGRKNTDVNIGCTWNTKELELTNSQITAQLRRNNGWKFNIRAAYEDPMRYPFIREWTATKTRCCTEVQFAYNSEREEYRLNFIVLALPHQKLGFYSGQEGFRLDESSFKTRFGGDQQ